MECKECETIRAGKTTEGNDSGTADIDTRLNLIDFETYVACLRAGGYFDEPEDWPSRIDDTIPVFFPIVMAVLSCASWMLLFAAVLFVSF